MKIKLTLVAMLFCTNAFAQNIAIVNGKAIPKSKYEAVLKLVPNPNDEAIQKKIKDTLINRELFLQEASRKNVMLRPEVQMQLEEAKNAVLFSAVLEDYLENSITEAELKNQYDMIVKSENGKQYRAKHILVKTEEEAKQILSALQQGKNFEELAKEKSIDTGSAMKGGDLDWAKPELFVPSFSKAMTSLEKGQTTKEAVKSQFGYHIIKLDDIKDATVPPFNQIKPQIVTMLKSNQDWQKHKLDELQKFLRSKAIIK